MFKRGIVFAVLLAVLLAFSGVSYAIGIEAALGVWRQSPSGDISYKSDLAVDRLDLENDLKYDDETQIAGRVKIDMPAVIPNVYLMITPMSFDGAGTRTENFNFGDRTFDVSAAFSSKVEMDQYDIAFYYSIPLMETATLNTLNIDIGLNAKVIDFMAEVRGTESGTGTTVTESESITLPVPMIYAGIQVRPVDSVAVEGEIRGIAYSSNHYYDVIARAKYKLASFFVAAGYRYEDIEIDEDDVKASITFSGPFAEAGIEF